MNAIARQDRIAELEAENEWLRAALGLREGAVPALMRAFVIPPQQARTLAYIYAARGRWVLRDFIEEQLPANFGERFGRTKIVQVYVSLLRRKLGTAAIIAHGSGENGAYRLPPETIVRLDAVMAEAG